MLPASYSFGLPCVFTVGGARLVFLILSIQIQSLKFFACKENYVNED